MTDRIKLVVLFAATAGFFVLFGRILGVLQPWLGNPIGPVPVGPVGTPEE